MRVCRSTVWSVSLQRRRLTRRTTSFKFLNSFFTVMEPGIRGNGGFVYQYVGDSIMALFPLVGGKFTDNAVQASLHLLKDVIPNYNAGRARAGYDPIRIGIGLNTGTVATGIAGTQERMDACAFGSTVNLAARCEGMTKEIGANLIITGDTYEKLENQDDYETNRLGETTIRGMERRIDLFEVTEYKGEGSRQEAGGRRQEEEGRRKKGEGRRQEVELGSAMVGAFCIWDRIRGLDGADDYTYGRVSSRSGKWPRGHFPLLGSAGI